MTRQLRALLIDDSELDTELLLAHLECGGYEVSWKRVDTRASLLSALAEGAWDIALCDYVMPTLSGPEALSLLRSEAPDLPVITVSGQIGEEFAVDVMRAGARDYVRKDNLARLTPAIEREVADAAARKAARQGAAALEMANTSLRLAADGGGIGFFVHDLRTGEVVFTDRWLADLGYRPGELPRGGFDALEILVHPDDLPRTLEAINLSVAADAGVVENEVRHRHRDGSYRWFLSRVVSQRDESGAVIRRVGAHIDITARKQQEEALALQATILGTLAEGVCMMTARDPHILYANPTYERLFGYGPGELIGQPPIILNASTPEQSAVDTEREILRQLAATGSWIGEVHNRKKDGTTFWTQAAVSTFRHSEHGDVWVVAQSDITDRKQAEAARRESDALFRNYFELGLVGMSITRPDGHWVQCNDYLYEASGYSREELQALTWKDVTHPDDLATDEAQFGRMLTGEIDGYEMDKRFVRKDGAVLWSSMAVRCIRDAAGAVEYVVAMFQDITDRRRAEQEIRDKEMLLRAVIEGTPNVVFVKDRDGRYLLFNPAAEAVSGVRAADLLGKDDTAWLPEEQARAMMERDRRVMEARELATFEEGLTAPDGRGHTFLSTKGPLLDAEGRLQGVFGVARDITELKERDAALQATQARLNFALDRSRIGGWELDLSDHTASRTLQHDRIFGYDELLPSWTYEMFLEHVLPEDREEVGRRFEAAMAAKSDWNFECRIRRRDGEVRWIWATGTHLPATGGGAGRMAGIVQDITERKQADEALRVANAELESRVEQRTRQLEAANRELEAFNYSVSHDLRAPLRHVQGFVDLLEKDFGAQMPDSARRYLSRVRGGSEQMQVMIDALLQLSRAGRATVTRRRLDTAGAVQAAWNDVCAADPDRSAAIHVGELPVVQADPTLLRQVFVNLLANARKFTRRAAEPSIEVGAESRDGETVFFVRDNGVGFEPSAMDKLFVPFQRLHGGEEFEGTGIGLSIVKRIVEKHGGRIWAEGAPDRGATFFFTLPAEAGPV